MLLSANPKASYLAHKPEIDQALKAVLEEGNYILGKSVVAFEYEFAEYIGLDYAIGVGSGTEALHLALRALEIKPGDAVATVSNTAVATVVAIELVGAHPVLIDIDPMTFTMDPNRLADTLKQRNSRPSADVNRIKAIVPVHLYGHAADMPAIIDIAHRFEARIIEDCAQAHGAASHGRKAGTWGDLSAFSFYPTKNLGALGDGGAVCTKDNALADRCRMLREYGWRKRYISDLPGMNTRLDEIQAAILRVKLRYLTAENARRRNIASFYSAHLLDTDVRCPQIATWADHVFHQYVVRVANRDALKSFLNEQQIAAQILYPMPIHNQPAYRDRVAIGSGGMELTETAAQEILSLPMHPHLAEEDVALVSQLVRARYAR